MSIKHTVSSFLSTFTARSVVLFCCGFSLCWIKGWLLVIVTDHGKCGSAHFMSKLSQVMFVDV